MSYSETKSNKCQGLNCNRWKRLQYKNDKYYCSTHVRNPSFIRNKNKRIIYNKKKLNKCQVLDCNTMTNKLCQDTYLCIEHLDEVKNDIMYCQHRNCLSLNDKNVQYRYLVKCLNSQYCIHHYEGLYTDKYIMHIEELNSNKIVCYNQECNDTSDNHFKSVNITNVNRMPKCYDQECDLYSKYEGSWNKWYCEKHYQGNICNINGCNNTKKLEYKHRAWYCSEHLVLQESIRSKIDHSGSQDEINARLLELKFRKDKDNNHIKYYINLKGKNINIK